MRDRTVPLVYLGILIITVIQALTRYTRVTIGSATMEYNLRVVWRPVAQAVREGAPLYVEPAVDNKPPLFQILNIILGYSGDHYLAFLLMVALSNTAVVILLYHFCCLFDSPKVGAMSGALYLAAIPIVQGVEGQIRSLALVGILSALLVRSPWARGAALAVGALIIQYAGLFLPVVWYDGFQRSEQPFWNWSLRFGAAGVITTATVFAIVFLLWGPDSARGAVYWTFFSPLEYAAGGQQVSLLTAPLVWGWFGLHFGSRIWFVLLPATFAVMKVVHTGFDEWGLPQVLSAGLILSLLPLLVRTYPDYWVMVLPFAAGLTSIIVIKILY